MLMRLLAAIAALGACASCAYSHVSSRTGDPCGDFSSTLAGIPPFYTPAGQFATREAACAQRETVSTLAAARNVTVQAAYSAAATVRGGARDEVARTGVAMLALDVACRDGDAAACTRLRSAMRRKGGAR